MSGRRPSTAELHPPLAEEVVRRPGVPGADAPVESAATAPRDRRYPTLDLLRVVAVVMTILVHTPSLTARVPGLRDVRFGLFLGVDLFMLISGWLLGGQIIRELQCGTFQRGRFYFKRWMRTLPPYYATLALVLLIPGHPLHDQSPAVVASHLAFVQEYLGVQSFGVSWSLCVEEHFYLLLPLLVPVLVRWAKPWHVVVGLAVTTAAELLGRLAAFDGVGTVPTISHLRSEGLFIGVGLAYFALRRPDAWRRLGRLALPAFIVGAPLLLFLMSTATESASAWLYAGLPTAGSLALALIFIAAVHERSPLSRVSFPGLAYLGELTYAIYLTHTLAPYLVPNAAFGSTVAVQAARAIAMVVLAVGLHHLVERPAMGLRARWLRRTIVRPVEATS